MNKLILQKNWITWHNNINMFKQCTKYTKGNLLDVGCGDKRYKNIFLPYLERYVGIDIPSKIKRETGLLRKSNIDIYATGLKLPFKSQSFDTIVSFQVLEHIPEPNEFIKEISRVIKENGYLIITAPQSYQLHEEPYDYYRYTKYGLKYLVEKNGFETISIEPLGGIFARIGMKISYLMQSKYYLLNKILRVFAIIPNISFNILDKKIFTHGDCISNIIICEKAGRKSIE